MAALSGLLIASTLVPAPAQARSSDAGGELLADVLGAPPVMIDSASLPQSIASAPAEPVGALADEPDVDREVEQILDDLESGETTEVVVALAAAPSSSDAAVDQDVVDQLDDAHSTVVDVADALPLVTLEVDAEGLADLAANDQVEAVQRVTTVEAHINSAGAVTQLDELHSSGIDGGAVPAGLGGWDVAIIDSGIRPTHQLFTGRIRSEWCYDLAASCPNGQQTDTGPGAASPVHWHGTNVAGIAAGGPIGATISGVPVTGAAPGAGIHAFRVLGAGGSGYGSDVIRALDKVYDLVVNQNKRIAVVNLSLGHGSYTNVNSCVSGNSVYHEAIQSLRSVGVLVVASAGNDGTPSAISAPACLPGAISVGNSEDGDVAFNGSSASAFMDMWAPGVGITSAYNSSDTSLVTATGTSMSAPHVSGAAAMIYSCAPFNSSGGTKTRPNRDDQVANLLIHNGVPLTDNRSGSPITKDRLDLVAVADALNLNNRFVNAVDLPGVHGTVADFNTCATTENGEPNHLGATSQSSVWFQHTAEVTGDLELSLCGGGPSFDSNITVWTGPSVSALQAQAANDDGCGANGGLSKLTMPVVANTTYHFAVSSDDAGAPFTLAWSYDGVAQCNGRIATWVGTGGNDVFNGTPGVDVVVSGAGDDTINTLGGDDYVCSGSGDDTIDGGSGNDRIFSGDGRDALEGGAGFDLLHSGTGNDIVRGGPGNDDLRGTGGNDRLFGDNGNDRINGGAGDDLLIGGAGDDRLWGFDGEDDLRGSTGQDRLFGHNGIDRVNGGPDDDLVTGGAGNDRIWGLGGNDDLRGATGADIVLGGLGNDSIHGGPGNDLLLGEFGSDELNGALGNDTLRGAQGNDLVIGAQGIDACNGGTQTDTSSGCESRVGFP